MVYDADPGEYYGVEIFEFIEGTTDIQDVRVALGAHASGELSAVGFAGFLRQEYVATIIYAPVPILIRAQEE